MRISTRIAVGAATLAVAAVPTTALASNTSDHSDAQKQCRAELKAMGKTTFDKSFGTDRNDKNAFGNCVSHRQKQDTADVSKATKNAAQTCKTQENDPNFAAQHSGKTFAQFYGTGKNGHDAFARCVSTIARANRQAEQQGRLNPARTCRALRTQLTSSVFDQTYGKNASDRNAFGKCVSQTAKTQAKNEVSASAACKAEQSDPNFAGTHGGKTFDQTYGTNADQSNAFGSCVSSTAKAASTANAHAIVRAALACKAAKKSDPAAFKAKYKTFGRCVATLAKSK